MIKFLNSWKAIFISKQASRTYPRNEFNIISFESLNLKLMANGIWCLVSAYYDGAMY
jgi:hypothetical protein